MLIGSDQRLNILATLPSVTMNGTRVEQVATTKSLGVTTDDKLIRKRRHCILYKVLIQPHFGLANPCSNYTR